MAGPPLKTLGRYQLERVLGKGAMGVVYEALDPKLHRKVAIKTILKNHLDEETSREYSMRFAREAQAVARLNHPNIVQVYDFGEEADVAYIVMEFIRGKELKAFFDANETFDRKDIVRIMSELLDALAFAHENGIVHRDIKPANVMLDHQGRAKLTDFGVARLTDVDRTQAERTQAGTMVGTPAYMSPEQIQGQQIDGRTDIFSSGVVLYQFFTGQRPFTGAGAWTIAKKIIQEDPPMPSTINVALPKEFDLVVSKALAKLPENRYLNARDFARALQRVLEGKSAENEDDATVMRRMPDVKVDTGDPGGAPAKPALKAAAPVPKAAEAEASQTQEVELEFWRAIKDSDDPGDFELYVQQFPKGVYNALAQRKITKLRRGLLTTGASDQSSSRIRQAEDLKAAQAEEEKLRIEEEEAVRHDAAAKAERESEEKARTEAEAKAKREAEEQAKRDAEEKSRREADEAVRREAEAKATREAEEKVTLEAAAKARREAEQQAKAKREAEEKARLEAAAKAKREAEEQAKRGAEETAKAKHEAGEKARLEAAAKARREAEEQAKREAEETAKAKRETEEKARLEAASKARREAEAKAGHEAEEKARRDAEAKARHDAEARARKEAEDRAREETRARARSEAAEKAQRAQAPGVADAVVGMPSAAPAGKKSSMLVAAMLGALVVAGGIAYFVIPGSKPALTESAKSVTQPAETSPAQPQAPSADQTAQDQARRATEEKAKLAEENARREKDAEDKTKLAADEKAKREAADKTKLAAEEKAKRDAADKTKLAAEEKAKRDAADKTKLAAEEKAKREAADKTKLAADEKAKKDAADKTKLAAEEKAKRDAATKQAADEQAKRDATDKAKLAADEKAKRDAADKAKLAADEQAKKDAAKAPPAQVASVQPTVSADAAYKQGLALEDQGNVAGAVKLYQQAARQGNGSAAKKLGDIFGSGKGSVSRDYQESLRWYAVARKSGESVPDARSR